MSELPPYIYGREAGQNEKVWTEAEVRMLARERDMLSARVLDMMGAAAQAAQPEAVGEPVINLTLTRQEAEYIAAFVSVEDNEPSDDVVTLMVGNGHSGYGLYAAHPEYPEEGAVFVRALASAQTPEPSDAERPLKSLNALIADQLRPFLKPGHKVIWREAFRWHDDNGVMPNHYDGMSVEGLAEDFGYQFDWDFNMNHAAIVRATKGGKL